MVKIYVKLCLVVVIGLISTSAVANASIFYQQHCNNITCAPGAGGACSGLCEIVDPDEVSACNCRPIPPPGVGPCYCHATFKVE